MKIVFAICLVLSFSEPVHSQSKKLEPPGPVEIAKAKIAIREAFGSEIEKAKTRAAKKELAAKMLGVANDADEKAGNRWLLYAQARELAVSAADLSFVAQALEDQDKAFAFNKLEVVAEVAEKLAKHTPSLGKPLIDLIYPAAEEAIELDDFKSAVRLLSVAIAVAKSSKKDVLTERKIESRLRIAKELTKLIESAKNDEDLMGRLRCFYQGAWERGLPLVVKSKDEELSGAAKKDLANPKEAKDQCEVGDAWFDLAQRAKGDERLGMLRRASWWYHMGVNGVTGLAKVKIETRLKKLAEEVEPGQPKEASPTELAVKPLAQWRFQKDAKDLMGIMDGTLKDGATIVNGRLRIDGKGGFFEVFLPVDVEARTLELWLYLPPFERPPGCVMDIGDTTMDRWDGIIFGEQPRKWYPGSNGRERGRALEGPDENSKSTQLIHIALVYAADNSIAMYRNGKPYGAPYTPEGKLQQYKKDMTVIRIGDPNLNREPFDVEEARFYNRALTAKEIATSFRLRSSRKK